MTASLHTSSTNAGNTKTYSTGVEEGELRKKRGKGARKLWIAQQLRQDDRRQAGLMIGQRGLHESGVVPMRLTIREEGDP